MKTVEQTPQQKEAQKFTDYKIPWINAVLSVKIKEKSDDTEN